MNKDWIKEKIEYAANLLNERYSDKSTKMYDSYNNISSPITIDKLLNKYGDKQRTFDIEKWIVRPLVYKEPMSMVFTDSEGCKYWFDGNKWRQYSDYLKKLLLTEFKLK